MLLAPSGGACVTSVDDGTMVLSPDRPLSGEVTYIPSAMPQVPSELEQLGEYYDPLELCGAFYEIAGVGRLGTASPRCGMLRGSSEAPDKLAELLVRPSGPR